MGAVWFKFSHSAMISFSSLKRNWFISIQCMFWQEMRPFTSVITSLQYHVTQNTWVLALRVRWTMAFLGSWHHVDKTYGAHAFLRQIFQEQIWCYLVVLLSLTEYVWRYPVPWQRSLQSTLLSFEKILCWWMHTQPCQIEPLGWKRIGDANLVGV